VSTTGELQHLLPPPSDEYQIAKRLYVEQFGAALVSNSYLRITVLCLSGLSLALMLVDIRTYQALHNLKPLIIRIDDVGRAEAVTYDSFQYQPREAEIRYFLMDFVQRHYSRLRATVRESYARSLYYLDGRLADATIEQDKKNKTIDTFLAGQGDEVEVNVKNVAIEDLRTSPFKATVDFEKVYYASADHQETKRERYVGHFVFVVKDRVPNALIPVNPLGLTITYFREDQAFQ
jgi:type IV secretory pathway TrbF-like protein